jgi:hypothetical protein
MSVADRALKQHEELMLRALGDLSDVLAGAVWRLHLALVGSYRCGVVEAELESSDQE